MNLFHRKTKAIYGTLMMFMLAATYELLSLNVGIKNVVPIIMTVLQSFTDKISHQMLSKTL